MSTFFKSTRGMIVVATLVLVISVAAFATVRALGDKPLASAEVSAQGASNTLPSSAPSGAALTVSIVRPSSVVWPETVTASGSVEAWQEAVVNAEIAGAPILEVLVDVGDQVARGQLLARFDDNQAQAMLNQQRASVAEAKARLTEASANAKRASTLESNRSLSEQDSIRAVTGEQTSRAQLDIALARLESQRLVVNNTLVVAPDAGIISQRNAMLGMVAAPGQELFRLIRQNRLEWRAELIATALNAVSPGDVAEIRLSSGETVTGTVRQIAPVINQNSRTGIVFVVLDAASQARVGMFASGVIKTGERKGLVLPDTTIVQRDGYEYVFAVDVEGGRVSQRKVRTDRRFGSQIEIVEGVSPTDSIVESGSAFLNDGDRVRIVSAPIGLSLGGAN